MLTEGHLLHVEVLERLVAVDDVGAEVEGVALVVQHATGSPRLVGCLRAPGRLWWRWVDLNGAALLGRTLGSL